MNWHYVDGDTQVGPVEQDAMVSLIRSGAVKSTTSVWRDGMEDWLEAGQTELASFLPRNAPPPFTGSTTPPSKKRSAVKDAGSTSFQRDPSKIYPSNPPRSPNLFLLGLLIIGLPQMLFGQVAKGICIFYGAQIAIYLITVVLTLLMGEFGIFLSGVLTIVILIQILRDAYKVGKALQSGRTVGKWEFFPN